MGPKCSVQEDLGPPFYMIAREEIPKEPRDTMSQNNQSLGPRGLPSQKKKKLGGKAEYCLYRYTKPECSVQEDPEPPFYMIALEEIPKEPQVQIHV